ncbi:MAG TPA: hypothetical protein VLZ33_08035 [Dysgonamonadaceae bacterium]|nr:hypothetical protein [Dysgonamonadaceae bacterium]
MRNLLLIATILFSGMLAKAQDIFFPTKKGTVLEYKVYDKNEKETGMVRYTITDVTSSGDNTYITYLLESVDANDKPIFKEEITISKRGDKLFVDMSKFLNKAAFKQGGEIPGEIEISGNEMEIPSNLKLGDILPDSNVEMALKMGFINLKMSADVSDRKVEAVENVTVEAGSFDTYKLTSTVSAKALGMKTSTSSAEWIAKGVGMVKSESYDKKGNVTSHTELVSFKE